ncbi:MAG: EamA family transporter [Saprospiraceae bacterium]|jgi:drug/metabolite transporter (DMT)-like permease
MIKDTRGQIAVVAAFAAVYIIWGSTYLINYFAIQEIPPFLMSGSRFMLAGGILFAYASVLGIPLPTVRQWRNGLLAGFLFLTLGTGLVVWSEQYIDTGLAALFVAFEPLVIVMMVWARRGLVPGWNSLLGVAVGVVGMVLLVGQPKISGDRETWLGISAITVAIFSWAFATIYVTEIELPKSGPQSAAVQMLGGGVSLLLIGLFSGEYGGFDVQAVGVRAWLSYGYLIFAGSILAYSAFNYLLFRVSPEKVATTNYVNPVVAMSLGWAFNGEQHGFQSILAAFLLLTGVFFINSRFVFGRGRKEPAK